MISVLLQKMLITRYECHIQNTIRRHDVMNTGTKGFLGSILQEMLMRSDRHHRQNSTRKHNGRNMETKTIVRLYVLHEMIIGKRSYEHHMQNSTREHNARNTETKKVCSELGHDLAM